MDTKKARTEDGPSINRAIASEICNELLRLNSNLEKQLLALERWPTIRRGVFNAIGYTIGLTLFAGAIAVIASSFVHFSFLSGLLHILKSARDVR